MALLAATALVFAVTVFVLTARHEGPAERLGSTAVPVPGSAAASVESAGAIGNADASQDVAQVATDETPADDAPLAELGDRRADLRRQRATIGSKREYPVRPAPVQPRARPNTQRAPTNARPAPPGVPTSPWLDVADQTMGRELRVSSVTAPSEGGVVVVYADENGTTGRVLGEQVLEPGHKGPTSVRLQSPPTDTRTVLVVLHHPQSTDSDAQTEPGAPVVRDGHVVRAHITVSPK